MNVTKIKELWHWNICFILIYFGTVHFISILQQEKKESNKRFVQIFSSSPRRLVKVEAIGCVTSESSLLEASAGPAGGEDRLVWALGAVRERELDPRVLEDRKRTQSIWLNGLGFWGALIGLFSNITFSMVYFLSICCLDVIHSIRIPLKCRVHAYNGSF